MQTQKMNPVSTQALLEEIKHLESTEVDCNGIKIQVQKNVFPPKNTTSTQSSDGLLDVVGEVRGLSVLDMGTGSGIQALLAVKKGAAKVTAVDISEVAIECARANFKANACDEKIELYRSDVFDSVPVGEKFDVIIANLPFVDYPLRGIAEATLYDPDLKLHCRFLSDAKSHLTSQGVIVLTHADLSKDGAFERIENIIKDYDYKIIMFVENEVNGHVWRVYKLEYNKQ